MISVPAEHTEPAESAEPVKPTDPAASAERWVSAERAESKERAEPAASPEPAVPAGATAAPSRAGRNLPAAIGVGVLLGAAVLVSLLTVRHLFIGIIAAAAAVGTVELVGALRRGADIRVTLWPVLLGGQAMVWLAWPFGRDGMLAAFVLTILACMVWRFRGGIDGYLRDVSASILTAAYVPLFAAFATLLVVADDGVARVLCFLILVVSSDTGGYIAGVLFGKHPMSPTISPKKSWEGFAGSMTAGIVAGVLTVMLMLDGQWWHGALFGAALVVTATVGDLVESLIKRDLGVKDMGQLLPGHGGLMDRLDSLLPAAVVSYLLLQLFVPA
jgi:phosphatidate cytidylyltransferase